MHAVPLLCDSPNLETSVVLVLTHLRSILRVVFTQERKVCVKELPHTLSSHLKHSCNKAVEDDGSN